MVRRGEPLSQTGVAGPERGGGLLIGESRVPRACRAATDPADGMFGCDRVGSLDLGDRPAESGELAGSGDRDDRPAFATLLEPLPGAVQSFLRGPGDRDRRRRLIGLALGQCFAEVRSWAVVPCRSTSNLRACPDPVFVIDPSRRC